ncbi:MAG: NAD(+)/NADH kinase [Planctomycetales bacterium]|nr:NAD(+)/NADH kinase [Planctomycetales bacterium]
MTYELPKSAPQWHDQPRVLLLGADKASIQKTVERLRHYINQHAIVVGEDFAYESDVRSAVDDQRADFAIVFGGDGSILRSAKWLGSHQIPVLGVNLGKLGFLADVPPHEFEQIFPSICAGQCKLVDHLMFRCQVFQKDQCIHDVLGLNETTIQAGAPFSMLDIDLFVDQEWVTSYSCDGLIVSTPVGSTAHSLSAGGPILRKNLQAFVISAISPHTLTVRPVVDSADRTYEMRVQRPNRDTTVVIDGQPVHALQAGDKVRVIKADSQFQLIEVPDRGYYRTLREKLGWGGRIRKMNKRRTDDDSSSS